MMELRITKDAQSAISLRHKPVESRRTESSFFAVWGVHIFSHNRRNFFLFTEEKTLFSIVVPWSLTAAHKGFEQVFRTSVTGAISALIEGPLPKYFAIGELVYTKTKNDGLRRAQADQIWRVLRLLDEGKNTFAINRVPYKSIGFKFPVDLLIQEVGDLIRANGDPVVFIPNDLRVN